MCAVFIALHTAIPNFQHVRVVPVSRTCELFQTVLPESDQGHTVICIINVSGGAPQVAGGGSPAPRSLHSPVADAEHDGAAGMRQRIAEFRVLHLWIEAFRIAPVNFYVIDSPGGVGLGILIFVIQAARPLFAGARASVGIKT